MCLRGGRWCAGSGPITAGTAGSGTCRVCGAEVAVHGPHVDEAGVVLVTGSVQVGLTLWFWSWIHAEVV